eukprot:gene15700-33163_t
MDNNDTTATATAIITSVSAVHTGMMQCACLHDAGRLAFPLDKDIYHLTDTCLWECCNASWEVSVCTAAPTATGVEGQGPSHIKSDEVVPVVNVFTPCCSNNHPMKKLTKIVVIICVRAVFSRLPNHSHNQQKC